MKYNHLTNIRSFLHGFLRLVGDNAPALYPNYSGGNKFKVIEELRKQGYNVHQASVDALVVTMMAL
ncbi:lipase-like domain-containing protein [Staphylococcus aureus]